MPLVNKKKVTIGMEEDMLKWSKIYAIKNDTSLSVIFEDYMKKLREHEELELLKKERTAL